MIAATVLGAALRLPSLGRQPLWADEANCLGVSLVRETTVWRALEHDCSPPLYYWLLRMVVGEGPGEARARALSAAFGILAPPLLVLVGTRLCGPPGAGAGIALALSPVHVWHSQEARMYSLVSLLGVVLAWTTASFSRARQVVIPFVACQVALLWSHHFALFAVAVSWALVAVSRRISTRGATVGLLVLGLAWAPAAWLLFRQAFVFHTGTWLPPPSPDAPLRAVGLWLAGVDAGAHSRLFGVPLGPVLGGLGAAPLILAGVRTAPGRTVAMLCGGTLALAWIVSHVVPAMVPGRYDAVVLPAFLLALASGWAALGSPLRAATAALLLAANLLGLAHYFGPYQKSAVRELVSLISAQESPGDAIIVVPEVEGPVVSYYYRGRLPVMVPPSFARLNRVDYAHYERRWADDEEARLLARACWERVPDGGRIFLLYSPYRATVHFKGVLMTEAAYTRIVRRVTGSGSTELALVCRRTDSGTSEARGSSE